MRTAGLRVFAAVVLTLALLTSTVAPLAAFAGPVLSGTFAGPDPGDVADAAAPGGRGHGALAGSVEAAQRLLDDDADYSQLLGLGQAAGSGITGGMDQPSLLTIPGVVLAAYRNAARNASSVVAGCTLDWPVLAGIGRVESQHGLFGGADTVIDAQGNIGQRIVGPALDGGDVASIPDSDGGRWDGDRRWDRAVGLMQFIPSSWRRFGQDGNTDGVRDPQNVFDATLAASKHLCSTHPGDLREDARLQRALFAYNRSEKYVTDVRRWIDIYRTADPADLTAATALQTTGERRFNPFSGLLSTVAFDGSLPTGPAAGAGAGLRGAPAPAVTPTPSTAQRSSTSDVTAPASERTRAPKPTSTKSPKPSPSPSPKPSPSPSPKPKPKSTPTPDGSPSPGAPASPAPSGSEATPSPAAPTEQGSAAPAPTPRASAPAPSPSAAAPKPAPSPSAAAPKPAPSPAAPKPAPSPAAPKPAPSAAAPKPAPSPPPSTPEECPTPEALVDATAPADPACEPEPVP